MTITRVKLENFTAFESLDLEPSPGINVLVGANGTGKTHFLKVCYAACDVTISNVDYLQKLYNVFLPASRDTYRLVNRSGKGPEGRVCIFRVEGALELSLDKRGGMASRGSTFVNPKNWYEPKIESVFIPAKEVLSNAPGFLSLYARREIHFEETYRDILQRAYLSALRSPASARHKRLLDSLESSIGGKVTNRGEEFFLSNKQGDLEFTLLAEGLRKLGLLWLLIRNGSLSEGSVLFWDEPETNLNPKLYGVVIEVLLELQRVGVQVFLATHDYVILRELDLQAKEGDKVLFHSLHKEDEGPIACHTTDKFSEIHPNAIMETFDSIYDREIKRNLAGLV